jgi:hypothetical protein
MSTELHRVISPLIESGISLREQRMALHEMFALAVTNVPDNETDNFTAKRLKPVYIALCEVLENIQERQ